MREFHCHPLKNLSPLSAVLRIRDDPGSEFFPSRIRIKEFKYFNPENCFLALGNIILVVHSGSRSRIRTLIFYLSRIRIRNTGSCSLEMIFSKTKELMPCVTLQWAWTRLTVAFR
jgi:hypothetical protein